MLSPSNTFFSRCCKTRHHVLKTHTVEGEKFSDKFNLFLQLRLYSLCCGAVISLCVCVCVDRAGVPVAATSKTKWRERRMMNKRGT